MVLGRKLIAVDAGELLHSNVATPGTSTALDQTAVARDMGTHNAPGEDPADKVAYFIRTM